MPLDGGHVSHPGEDLHGVADGGEDELDYSSLAMPGVCDPGRLNSPSCPLHPGIPAAALRMMQWFFCFLSKALSLSPAVKGMATKLASSSSFERERSSK